MFDKILTTKDVVPLCGLIMLLDSALAGYINHREDKFLRATNYKHYAGDDKQTGKRYAELPSRSKSKSSAKPKKVQDL